MKKIPEEIKEARQLLDKFEKDNDPERKPRYFQEALDIFANYLKENQSSPFKDKIRTLKLTYTRYMLQHLNSMIGSDVDNLILLRYVNLLHRLKDEVLSITKDNENLKKIYDAFFETYKVYLLNYLESLKKEIP